jgi:hypothetical protein
MQVAEFICRNWQEVWRLLQVATLICRNWAELWRLLRIAAGTGLSQSNKNDTFCDGVQ